MEQELSHPNGTVIMTDAPLVENAGDVTVAAPALAEAEAPEPEPAGMDDDLKRRTVWVGGIPSNIVQGSPNAVLNINANKHVKSLMSTFGPVASSTVRVKPGVCKSWALVTFETTYGRSHCHCHCHCHCHYTHTHTHTHTLSLSLSVSVSLSLSLARALSFSPCVCVRACVRVCVRALISLVAITSTGKVPTRRSRRAWRSWTPTSKS